jgi:CheY-like chemotaxis protein
MKILVADDNVHDREAIAFFLKSHGYEEISLAKNGQECVEKAIDERPDVVILDVQLTDMQGYGICKALKLYPGLDCKVILITGNYYANDQHMAREANPDYFLAKTGFYDGLLKILQSLKL